MSSMSNTQHLRLYARPITVIKTSKQMQNTSLEISGLRMLSDKNTHVCAKLIWLFVTLAATVICVIQSAERITLFASDPSKVNVYYIQKNTMIPPVITICPYCVPYYPHLFYFWVKKQYGERESDALVWNLVDQGNISSLDIWNFTKLDILNVTLMKYESTKETISAEELTSVSEVSTVFGICHRIKINVELSRFITQPRFVLEINEAKKDPFTCKMVSLNVPEESAIDEYLYHSTSYSVWEHIDMTYVARITESNFRNTSNYPCGDSESVSICLAHCFETVFIPKVNRSLCSGYLSNTSSPRWRRHEEPLPKATIPWVYNKTLTLPFLRHYDNTLPCRTKAEVKEMTEVVRAAAMDFLPVQCDCMRKCRQVQYTADYIFAKNRHYKTGISWLLEVNVPDGRITVIEEEAAYTGFDIFADLGGCVGLWLGLCLLQMLEIGSSFCGNHFKFLRKCLCKERKPKPVAVNGRRFRIVVVRESSSKTDFSPSLDFPGFHSIKQESPIWVRIAWLTVSLITLFICIYQCGERIAHYFSDPSSVNVYFTDNVTVPYPSIMVCNNRSDGFIPALSERLIENALGKHRTYHDVMQLITNRTLNIEDAWNMSIFPVIYTDTNRAVHNDWISSIVSTIVGNCVNFQPRQSIEYKIPSSAQVLQINPDREKGTKLIIIYPKEELDLVKYLLKLDCTELTLYTKSHAIQTAFRVTQISYRNLPSKPCLEREQEVRCLEECLERKVTIQIPQGYCRLPFMTTNTSTCSSAADMERVLNITFSVIDTFNIEDCNCFKACTQFVYNKEYFTAGDLTNIRGVKLSIQMQVWDKEVMVIEEIEGYNGFSLFVDLGGSLGLFSGLCIINLFEIVEVLYFKLKSRSRLNQLKQPIEPPLHHRRLMVLESSPHTLRNNHRNMPTLANESSTESNPRLLNRIIWFLISTGLLCPCLYLSLERIAYYLSDPSVSTTYYSQNKTIKFPVMVMCPKVEYSIYFEQRNEAKFRDYWNMAQFKTKINNIEINWSKALDDEIILSKIETAAGICFMLIPNKTVQYNEQATQISAKIFDFRIKLSWAAVFPVEKLPLIRYLGPSDSYFASGSITYKTQLSVRITEIVNRNTRKFPCEDGVIVASCLVDCIERKIYISHDKNCSLPFMQESNDHGLCQTKEEYLEVKKATLNVLKNFRKTDCNCARECKSTVYSLDDLHLRTVRQYSIDFSVGIRDDSFPTIQEEAAYSFIKLLSDLGGSLGLFFGLGLLQFLEMLTTTTAQLKTLLKLPAKSHIAVRKKKVSRIA